MENNQTKNPLLAFGTPSRIRINGIEIERQHIDVVVKTLGTYPRAIKAMAISRIEKVVKIQLQLYSQEENKRRFSNKYGIDVEDYCQKHACMDCEHFNHTYMTEINRNCPLLKYKDMARECFCLKTILSQILFNNPRGGGHD